MPILGLDGKVIDMRAGLQEAGQVENMTKEHGLKAAISPSKAAGRSSSSKQEKTKKKIRFAPTVVDGDNEKRQKTA